MHAKMFRQVQLCLIAIFIFLPLSILSESPSTCQSPECKARLQKEADVTDHSSHFAASYRQCLLDGIKNTDVKVWNQLPSTIRSCLAREDFSTALKMVRLGEPTLVISSKVVVLPLSIDSECVAVIVRFNERYSGEGSAEEEMTALFPGWRQHIATPGMDARYSKRTFYDKIIAFDEYGEEMWEEFARKFSVYALGYQVDPRHITLKNFLEKHVKEPRVDYLWIDSTPTILREVRGLLVSLPDFSLASYSILKSPTKIKICQVTMNTPVFLMHKMFEVNVYTRAALGYLIPLIISDSSFLPIHSEFLIKEGVFRTLYFNVASPYCLKKFLGPNFCGKEPCQDDEMENLEAVEENEDLEEAEDLETSEDGDFEASEETSSAKTTDDDTKNVETENKKTTEEYLKGFDMNAFEDELGF